MTTTAPTRCTFCGQRESHPTTWRCTPFRIRDPDGDFPAPEVWQACPVCDTHIRAHNLNALAERMTTGLACSRQARTGEPPALAEIAPEARRVCAAFLALRDEDPS